MITGLIVSGILFSCTSAKNHIQNQIGEDQEDQIQTDISVNKTDDKTGYLPESGEYEAVFADIRTVIEQLNRIIRGREYYTWLEYLTDDYIKEKSDPVYLEELSDTPVIKNKQIVLKNLKDYFFYVVVPSRYNVKLDKISFIDRDHVNAYMYIDNEYVILYYLEKYDNVWKIGTGKKHE